MWLTQHFTTNQSRYRQWLSILFPIGGKFCQGYTASSELTLLALQVLQYHYSSLSGIHWITWVEGNIIMCNCPRLSAHSNDRTRDLSNETQEPPCWPCWACRKASTHNNFTQSKDSSCSYNRHIAEYADEWPVCATWLSVWDAFFLIKKQRAHLLIYSLQNVWKLYSSS